ncbi:MAG: glucosamine-6-phosphate deaminase [Clostridiales bacterium]|nr:glucosamine-6-phosphate deaminase [Clostridiales bacterium]
MTKIIHVKTREEMSAIAAKMIKEQINAKPDSVLGLATGSTPELTYAELCSMCERGEVDFSKVKTVNLDEYVGLDETNDQSYRYYMNSHLFDKVNIKPENTHLPCGTADNADAACDEYSELLEKIGTRDIQLLGIGKNGHIGFCEPDTELEARTSVVALTDSTLKANSRFFESVDAMPKKAMTMGMAQIFDAKQIILIAYGKEKVDIVTRALTGKITTNIPASLLQLHMNVTAIIADE